MPDPQQEVIRVDENGHPVIADWDENTPSPEEDHVVPPEHTRAQQEATTRASEKRERIVARLKELNVSKKRMVAIMEMPDATLMAGVERWYSAAETARFFSRSNQWLYERLKKHKFRYANGDEIKPFMVKGGKRDRARFTLDIIREMALSCYRNGTVKDPELKMILRRVAQAEVGEVIFDPEED